MACTWKSMIYILLLCILLSLLYENDYKNQTLREKLKPTTMRFATGDLYIELNSTLKKYNDILTNIVKDSSRPQNCPLQFSTWKKNLTIKNEKEIERIEKVICSNDIKNKCSVSNLVGPLAIWEDQVSFDWIYKNELQFVQKGGWWAPEDCLPTQRTLIVIPFRNREEQLPILLRHLHPVLKRQNLHYRIIVIEQHDEYSFNRAKLINIGFIEGLKYFPYKCFIMHDVDLVPENDKIDYGCKSSPKHLSVAVNTFHYILPYQKLFGGVASMWGSHFEQVNGCSNVFWRWGGEDDNLSKRLTKINLSIQRQPVDIARYKMLSHPKQKQSRAEKVKVYRHYKKSLEFFKEDGLNSLQYDIVSREEKQLYTLIKVNLRKDKSKKLF